MAVKFSHLIDSCLLLDAESYLHLEFPSDIVGIFF